MRILPLRIIETDRGLVIRCLCGAESAVIRQGLANPGMLGLRGSGHRIGQLASDVTPAGVLNMALHARNCHRAADLLAAQPQP